MIAVQATAVASVRVVPPVLLSPDRSLSTGQRPGSSASLLGPLLRITQALSSEIETEKVYEAILGVVREVTGAQRVSIQLLAQHAAPDLAAQAGDAPAEVSLVLVAALGLPTSVRVGTAMPAAHSVAAWVLRHGQPLLLNGATHPDPTCAG